MFRLQSLEGARPSRHMTWVSGGDTPVWSISMGGKANVCKKQQLNTGGASHCVPGNAVAGREYGAAHDMPLFSFSRKARTTYPLQVVSRDVHRPYCTAWAKSTPDIDLFSLHSPAILYSFSIPQHLSSSAALLTTHIRTANSLGGL